MNSIDALNKLCKWRLLLAGQMLGTKPDTDPTCKAVRDLMDFRLLIRAEMNTTLRLLMDKGIISQAEWEQYLTREAISLDQHMENLFKGFKSTANGVDIVDQKAATETLKGFPP